MNEMKVLELFAGTRSIGKAFEKNGHEVYSIEWNKDFENIDWNTDIGKIKANDILERFGKPDVIWASPDCTSYSIAAISHHRTKESDGNLAPKSDYAKFCDNVNQNMIRLIKDLNPKYFFIENPRGGMRKMNFMKDIPRYTVTYCQYGDTRMKPTDLWTNHPNPNFKPMCKNGAPCHVSAPRGSKTGTQGLKNSKLRSIIPAKLCEHIVAICEE
ncbi:DNA (cytosine-5-)-methyltransferase [Clostridium botulinum B str. Eklund 17B (NRP)]|uniref:DNA (Cytosine-5-)-methyltransferase n=2 Tax=Clostridium botulinum TaxID=1491 RepID=B2TME5_CLOBB|nr:DNA (cytosine-5-)-methyltransferase [Clostridium botulinum B str. Eklund 17B (NRP)]